MSPYHWVLCLIIRHIHIVNTRRKEEHCFIFSQVQPFKYGIAHLLRTEAVDAESKRDYHRKTEHIGIIPVLQPDISLYFVLFQYATFIHGTDSYTKWRDNYPEQFHKFWFTHPYISDIFRHNDVAGFVHGYDVSFYTHDIVIPLNVLLNLSPNIVRSLSSFCVVIFA